MNTAIRAWALVPVLLALSVLPGVAGAVTVSINFDDGTHGVAVGGFYAGLGPEFSNARWRTSGALPGVTVPFTLESISAGMQPKQATAIVVSFDDLVLSVASVTAADVSVNGARMDAYDALIGGNLVDFDQFVDSLTQAHTLSVAAPGIRRLELYQPLSVSTIDNVVFDNFSFTATAVPAPGTLLLLAAGLAALGLVRRR